MKTYVVETDSNAVKFAANNLLEAIGCAETCGYRMVTIKGITEVKEARQQAKAGPVPQPPWVKSPPDPYLSTGDKLIRLRNAVQPQFAEAESGSTEHRALGAILDLIDIVGELVP
jgi:hypothetical protein